MIEVFVLSVYGSYWTKVRFPIAEEVCKYRNMRNFISGLLVAVTIIAVAAVPAVGQSSTTRDVNQTSATSENTTQAQPETITGRITKLDTASGKFSVRVGKDGRIVDLLARKDIDTKSMRRGERVIVTYTDGVALKVEATRNEK